MKKRKITRHFSTIVQLPSGFRLAEYRSTQGVYMINRTIVVSLSCVLKHRANFAAKEDSKIEHGEKLVCETAVVRLYDFVRRSCDSATRNRATFFAAILMQDRREVILRFHCNRSIVSACITVSRVNSNGGCVKSVWHMRFFFFLTKTNQFLKYSVNDKHIVYD